MDKKKAIKLATASAVAASAFVAANPHASEAAVNVDAVVKQAKASFTAVYNSYKSIASTGKLVDVKKVQAAVAKADKAYANAVATVKKSGGKKKDAYLADLEKTYKQYVVNGGKNYVKAYDTLVQLEQLHAALEDAVAKKDLAKVESNYHKLSAVLKKVEGLVKSIYGAGVRAALLENVGAAKTTKDGLIYDVTVYMKLNAADAAVKADKLADAEKALADAEKWLAQAAQLKAELTAQLTAVKAAYEAKVTPKVVSVSAVNAVQVVIKFNKTVDKTTAETEANYQINGVDLTTAVATATLNEDKKSVTLTFVNNQNNSAFNLKVKGDAIKTEDKTKTIAEYVDAVKVNDSEGPKVIKTEFAANGNLEITFSEPLQAVNPLVRVNDVPVATNAVADLDTKVVVPAANLPSIAKGATASVYVAQAQDMASNTMDIYTGSVVKPNDTVAPTITSLTQVGHNTVRFVFSEPVVGFTGADLKVLKGSTLYSVADGNAAFTINQNTTVDPSGKTYDVQFNLGGTAPDFGIYSSTSNTQTLTFLIDANAMTDAAGNNLGAYTQSVTMTKDVTGPVFDKAAVASDKQTLELTFNEDIKTAATDIDETKIIVTDANGVRYSVENATTVGKSGDNKTLLVDFIPVSASSQTIANGTYTVQVQAGAVKDVLGNSNAAFTTSVVVGSSADTSKPSASLDTVNSAENKFVVDFSEQVGPSALNPSNYALDGKSLPAGTIIYFNSTAKDSVTIELPEGSINFGKVGTTASQAGDAPALLRVSNVADVAGNVMNATTLTVDVADNTSALLQSVQVIGNDIVLTFNEALDSTTVAAINDATKLANNFEIKVNGTDLNLGTTGAAVTTSLVVGNSKQVKISLTTGTGHNWDPTAAVTVKVKSTATIKDANLFTVKEGTAVSKQ